MLLFIALQYFEKKFIDKECHLISHLGTPFNHEPKFSTLQSITGAQRLKKSRVNPHAERGVPFPPALTSSARNGTGAGGGTPRLLAFE